MFHLKFLLKFCIKMKFVLILFLTIFALNSTPLSTAFDANSITNWNPIESATKVISSAVNSVITLIIGSGSGGGGSGNKYSKGEPSKVNVRSIVNSVSNVAQTVINAGASVGSTIVNAGLNSSEKAIEEMQKIYNSGLVLSQAVFNDAIRSLDMPNQLVSFYNVSRDFVLSIVEESGKVLDAAVTIGSTIVGAESDGDVVSSVAARSQNGLNGILYLLEDFRDEIVLLVSGGTLEVNTMAEESRAGIVFNYPQYNNNTNDPNNCTLLFNQRRYNQTQQSIRNLQQCAVNEFRIIQTNYNNTVDLLKDIQTSFTYVRYLNSALSKT